MKNEKNELKQLVVDYVGNKLDLKNGEVRLEHVIEVFSIEFPEFLLPLAEENYMRGYEQALEDRESVMKEMQDDDETKP